MRELIFSRGLALQLFKSSSAWVPAVEQSPRGTSVFLASLYTMCEALTTRPEEAQRVLAQLAAAVPYPVRCRVTGQADGTGGGIAYKAVNIKEFFAYIPYLR